MADRRKGCFYGCAVGDALGAPLEFEPRDKHPRVVDMMPVAQFGLEPGSWTDDTSMMLCLAASYAQFGKQHPESELTHYMEWFSNGYLSVNGVCFDMGRIVTRALIDYERHGYTTARTNDAYDQGNGSLMRIASVPIVHWARPDAAYADGYASSVTTHSHPVCAQICGVFAALCAHAIQGKSKTELLDCLRTYIPTCHSSFHHVLSGDFMKKTRDDISSSGYVVHTFEAACWAFFTTETFEQGAILVVNLADDADTVGAVYGTLAGAFYGFTAIPVRWSSVLQGRHLLDGVYADLLKVGEVETPSPKTPSHYDQGH